MAMKDYNTIIVGTDGSALAAPTVARAAWLANRDDADLVIICAYGQCDEAEAATYKPTCVYVDRDNRLTHTNHSMPKQAA